MPVTERVMAAGAWEVDLTADTPRRLLEAIDIATAGFGQLVVLPVWLDPRQHTDADMLTLARWSGVFRGMRGRTLYGAGAGVLLGDEAGKGDVFEVPRSTSNGWLSQWIAPSTSGGVIPLSLNVGTVQGPGGSYRRTFYLVTAREALEAICDRFGVEWRIRPNFQIDVGSIDQLYGATPRVVILQDAGDGGRDAQLVGVRGNTGWDRDLEDYATKVIYQTERETGGSTRTMVSSAWWDGGTVQTSTAEVVDEETTTETVLTTATTSEAQIPFGRPADGGPAIWDMLVQASSDDDDESPATMAARILSEHAQVRRELTVDAGVADVGLWAPVGSYVWLYGPPAVMDLSSPVPFRGRTLWPVKSRLMGATWPITRGMGVYLRVHAPGVLEWHDLTGCVEWESGDARLEVAALPRPSRPVVVRSRPKPSRK